ncbi:hypothetical protein HW44_17430 [Nitrosococcus oceani]|nr:hypothetical protein HW44_17430 [Nitrosococcus oceani]
MMISDWIIPIPQDELMQRNPLICGIKASRIIKSINRINPKVQESPIQICEIGQTTTGIRYGISMLKTERGIMNVMISI